jgi:hypothetical protein
MHAKKSLTWQGFILSTLSGLYKYGGAKSEVWCTIHRFKLPSSTYVAERSKAVFVVSYCFLTLVCVPCCFLVCSMFPFSHSFIIIFAPPVPFTSSPLPLCPFDLWAYQSIKCNRFPYRLLLFPLLYYLVIIMSMLCRMPCPGFVCGPPGHLSSLGCVVVAYIERRRRLCLMILFTIFF